VEFAMHRIRTPLTATCLALTLLACTSDSEAVPVPGADAVVTAPVASVELPPTAEPPDTQAPTTDQAATTAAPVPTEAPASSTIAPGPAPETSPETTFAPPATDAPVEDVFLRIGDEGPEVGAMQLKLSVLDYLEAGSDTGVFDEATQRGLRSFQADYGLGVDGVFGPLTGRALNAAAQSVVVEG
jgi:murein L,D-transpeptidase YcbB/YkuD